MDNRFSFSGTLFGFVAIMLVVVVSSCNKKFDEPPLNADPNITADLTIKDLKARYASIGNFQTINDDKTISGIVIADDRSGNFYKQIIIQDETGGIPIMLDGNNVYTTYPVGRRVFVKVKGLMLGDYGGTIQLGLDSVRSDDGRYLNLGRIPQAQFDQFIIKGSFGNVVTPKVVKPSDFTKAINDPLLSTLVQINNAEFRDADLNKAYADTTLAQSAINFTIKTCDNQSVVLRNSSYARFAGLKVAQGNGALLGVSSIFNGTLQMFIRDTSDLKFSGTRCSGQAVTKTIAEVLKYATGDSTIPASVWIDGTVVSDIKNEAALNYRLQDATAGIQLRFLSSDVDIKPSLGDKIKVLVGGLKLSQYKGGLQISGIESAVANGTGTVTPRIATIADIIANARAWESTVVTIKNATFPDKITIKDATGQVATYIYTSSGIVVYDSATSVTGYVSVYNNLPQVILRTQADIVGGRNAVTPPATTSFTATFDFAGVTTTSGTTDPSTVPAATGLTFGSFTAVGLGANSSGSGRFSFTGWPLGATNSSDVFTGAIDLTKYYEVTITPASGKKLDLTKLAFTLQRSSTGIRQYAVRSSIDNYAANLPASINPANANLSVVASDIFQVADAATTAQDGSVITFGANHTNVTSAVTLRFYGFNAESSGGTFSIDNVVIEGVVK